MTQLRTSFGEWWTWVPELIEQPAVIFDIETDGLLDTVTKIHSIVLYDTATGEMFSAHHDMIPEALERLANAPILVGHHIIRYDIAAIRKLYPNWNPKGFVFDTLNASRLIYTNIKDLDFRLVRKNKMPAKMAGRHSLESWGYRLGVSKDDFGKTTDWKEWSPEMQSYCEQDVEVTRALYQHILSLGYSQRALALEMDFQKVIWAQEETGMPFDSRAAEKLYIDLAARRSEIEVQLKEAFPPERVEEVFIPKVNNRNRGYIKGEPFIKVKHIEFNPNSRPMIAKRLKEKYNWEPSEFTETGEPKLDGDTLSTLNFTEAKLLAAFFDINKIIGMLAEGNQAWLKLVTNAGRIHGEVTTNGAVTGRCTHKKPNLAQIPRKGELGKACRGLFRAEPGWVMVGCDASGLELRMFGHYLARYDGGAYIDVVLNGDIHTHNQHAAGLPTRDNAKTFIYAFLYGAGDEKLGSIVAPLASPNKQAEIGRRLRAKFLKALPALKRLVEAVKAAHAKVNPKTGKKRGFLLGVDGRKLHVRSSHAALNTLLQSAGAVLMKLATVMFHWMMEEKGYTNGKDYFQIAHVHDEAQFMTRPELADTVGQTFVEAIEEAGRALGFRCPTTGEYKIGPSWNETH